MLDHRERVDQVYLSNFRWDRTAFGDLAILDDWRRVDGGSACRNSSRDVAPNDPRRLGPGSDSKKSGATTMIETNEARSNVACDQTTDGQLAGFQIAAVFRLGRGACRQPGIDFCPVEVVRVSGKEPQGKAPRPALWNDVERARNSFGAKEVLRFARGRSDDGVPQQAIVRHPHFASVCGHCICWHEPHRINCRPSITWRSEIGTDRPRCQAGIC